MSHSASVSATLRVDDIRIPLAKTSPTLLFFESGHECRAGIGVIEMTVDGSTWNISVVLHAPIRREDTQAVITVGW